MQLIGIEEIRLFVKDKVASARFYADVFDVSISHQGLLPKFKLGSQQIILWDEKHKADYPCTPANFVLITSTSLLEVEEELRKKGVQYRVTDKAGLDETSIMLPAAIQIQDVDGYSIELRNSLYPKDFGRIVL